MNLARIKILAVVLLLLANLSAGAQDCNDNEIKKSAKKTFKKAMDDLRYGRYLEATKKLQKAVDDDPGYLEAWWVMADINSRYTNRMRKTSIARQAYEEVIRICPSYEDYYAYFYLGRIYFAAQQYKKARQMFETFIKSDSDNIREEHLEEAEKQAAWAKFYDEIYSHKVPFNPVKVDKVSTPQYDEYLAIITQDNEYMYFTRRMPDKRVSGFTREDNRIEKFCIAKKTSANTFEVGRPLPEPFNKQPNEGGATLTVDNKHMFYTRCKYMPNRYFNCDIYEEVYIDGEWEDKGPLGHEINRPDSWESMPTVSSDGNTMYFVSDRKDNNYGGLDIYMTRRGSDGKWSEAVNMGPSINTAGNEKSPFIHTDSQTLYFSSAGRRDRKTNEYFPGHKGLGGYDIFYTRLDGKNSWIEPKNIGYPINSENNDLGFFVSTDGRYGFFASNKFNENKNWDIYSFELYKEARPQKVLLMKGVLRDEETKEVLQDASIEIKDLITKKKISIPVDAHTGEYAFAVTFKNDYMVTVKKRDYVYVSKYISKKDVQYQVPVKLDFKLQRIEVGKHYKLEDIHFATDSARLTEESKDIVESFFEFLSENPNIKIEIQGHTDNVGSDAYNKELSERRARTVYEVLLAKGIDASRMKYKGYGESMPVADNSTEEGRARNRRTVFVITQK